MEDSDCDQVVLLLDCCYSGAVESGLRGDIGSELHTVENARGFYIMTASSDMQAARETERVSGGAVMGHFTAALVNGIESGAADHGRKGKVLLSDLRRYLEQVVTGQTPQFFARRASGDPLISLSPATALPLLDPGVLADLNAEQWYRRSGAVSALAGVLRDGDAGARSAAKAALQLRLGQERDFDVRAALESALGLSSISEPDVPAPSPPSQTISSSSSSGGRAETAEEASTRGESLYKAGRYAEAARAFKVAADQGNATAQYSLGDLYERGQGVQQSFPEAARLYKLAADQGNAAAQYSLGELYMRGQGVQQSFPEAARLYKLAADQGSVAAQYSLGGLYKGGQVQQSYPEAARLYKLAADQGYAAAQYSLGQLYMCGQGVQQSYPEAVRLYKLAADQGHMFAPYRLGDLYERGQGVQQSTATAVDWYRKAARQSDTWAQDALRRLGQTW